MKSCIVDKISKVPLTVRENWAKSLIFNLRFLHEIGVVHGNINLQNIHVDSRNKITIVDNRSPDLKRTDSLLYKSPEFFFGSKNESKDSDVWAAGICVYYIIAVKFPWQRASISDRHYMEWVKEGKLSSRNEGCFEVAIKIMLGVSSRPPLNSITKKFLKPKLNSKIICKFLQ